MHEKTGSNQKSTSVKGGNKTTLTTNIVRFLIAGFSKTALDILLFYIFANIIKVSFFSLPPRTSALFITCPIIMTLSFLTSNYWVYKSEKKKRKTFVPWLIIWILNSFFIQGIIIQFVYFVIIHIEFIMSSIDLLNLLCKVIGVGITMFLNFCMNYFLFKKSPL